jgi:hypothetical protein
LQITANIAFLLDMSLITLEMCITWLWNPKTGRVHETCDVIWLHHMFYEKQVDPNEVNIVLDVKFEDDDQENTKVQVGEQAGQND